MIKTEKIKLTSKSFFKVLMTVYLKKRWWLLLWLFVLSVFFAFNKNRDGIENFFMFFGFIYPIIIVGQHWRYANSQDNNVFFLERDYEIYNNRIVGNLSDGTTSTILIENFVNAINLKDAYLLYFSKIQFIYIPKEAFQSEKDLNWFENQFLSKIK